jgi:hypothetical protein
MALEIESIMAPWSFVVKAGISILDTVCDIPDEIKKMTKKKMQPARIVLLRHCT